MSAPYNGFDYRRPTSLNEALTAMDEPETLPLAGGTDFVSMRNLGVIDPAVTVDLKGIPELRGVRYESESTVVGTCATMAEISSLSVPSLGALRDGAGVVGAVQTRNRATIGGNVCRSSPAGDTLPPLLVLHASATLEASDARRTVPIAEFFSGPGQNVRRPNEILTELGLPQGGGASAYQRHTYRAWMDLAVVGVAVWIETDGARCAAASVAIGGAAPTPRLVPEAGDALVGSRLEERDVGAARDAVVRAADPIDDVRGSRAHRLEALGVLTERVVATARARANTT